MKKLNTSIITIICVAAATSLDTFAAPTVRAVGGAGTYVSAAAANTAGRAGSLRTTSGLVRPGVSTSSATKSTSSASTGAGATNTSSSVRVASSPRLSIGKYIGSGKAISSSSSSGGGTSSEVLQRLEDLEHDVAGAQSDITNIQGDVTTIQGDVAGKQNILSGSTYVVVENDEVSLNLDALRDELSGLDGADGREVEIGTRDGYIVWRYLNADRSPATEWANLIALEDLRGPQGPQGEPGSAADLTNYYTISQTDQAIANAIAAIDLSAITSHIADTDIHVSETDRTTWNSAVQPGANVSVFYNDAGYLTAHQDISGKLDKDQGIGNAGKVMIVGETGLLEPGTAAAGGDVNVIETVKVNDVALTPDASKAVNVSVPTAVSQLLNDTGFITTSDVPAQVQSDWNAVEGVAAIANKPSLAAVATSGAYSDLTGTPANVSAFNNDAGYLTAHQDISGKLDKDQGIGNAGKVMIVGETGILEPGTAAAGGDENIIESISVNGSELTPDASKGVNITVPTATSDLSNDSGFITSADVPAQVQSNWNETNTESPAYIQNKPSNVSVFENDAGYLTDADIEDIVDDIEDDLNLGALASKDTIDSSSLISDGVVTKAKLDANTQVAVTASETYLVDELSGDGEYHVVAKGPDGKRVWMQVAQGGE